MLFDNHDTAQLARHRLSEVVLRFGMRFAPVERKVLQQGYPPLNSPLTLHVDEVEVVVRFVYLRSCIIPDCNVIDKISARIAKARVAFSSSPHLWKQIGVSVRFKGKVLTIRQWEQFYFTAVRLGHSELITSGAFKRLMVAVCASLLMLTGCKKIHNGNVRGRVSDDASPLNDLDQDLKLHRLRWLGRVLCMPANC